jgi:hypothetical protein
MIYDIPNGNEFIYFSTRMFLLHMPPPLTYIQAIIAKHATSLSIQHHHYITHIDVHISIMHHPLISCLPFLYTYLFKGALRTSMWLLIGMDLLLGNTFAKEKSNGVPRCGIGPSPLMTQSSTIMTRWELTELILMSMLVSPSFSNHLVTPSSKREL